MAGQGADMLRTLLIFALPCTLLLADAPGGQERLPGRPRPLSLADIPLGRDTAEGGASELASPAGERRERGPERPGQARGHVPTGARAPPRTTAGGPGLAAQGFGAGQHGRPGQAGRHVLPGPGRPPEPGGVHQVVPHGRRPGRAVRPGLHGGDVRGGRRGGPGPGQAYVWLAQAQAGGDTDAAEPFQQVRATSPRPSSRRPSGGWWRP